MRMKILGLAVASLTALGLAGCGSDAKSVLSGATGTVCTAVDNLQEKLADVGTVKPETTPEQLQSAQEAADKLATGLQTVADKVGKDVTAEIDAARQELSSAVEGAKDSESVQAAKTKVEAAVQKLNAGVDKVQTTLKCPS